MPKKQKKEPICINRGYIWPDGTLHPEPPQEFIERVNWAFQVEHELEESSKATEAG